MRRNLVRCTLAISLTALVGCTSLQVIAGADTPASPISADVGRALAPNDLLTITRFDGSQQVIRLSAVSPGSIDGVDDRSSQKVSLPLEQVQLIERREFSGVKTAFLVTGIALGVYVVARAAAQAALLSQL